MKLVKMLLATLFICGSLFAKNAYEGIVTEVINGGGYTYLQIEEQNKKRFWIAVTGQPVKEGTQVRFKEEMVIKDFQSKALNRKFDEIMFASDLQYRTDKKLDLIDQYVEKSPYQEEDSITIADLIKNRKAYEGKKIQVRAKVVKTSPNIIKRNWIHLQDGTGVDKKIGRVVFTSPKYMPNVGEIVTASGVVAVDKDFGSGYVYKVIVEDSTFKK